MASFFQGILDIVAEFANYIYVLVAVALLCLAVAGLVGGDEVRSKIKQNLLWIFFFAALGIGAVQFAQWGVGKFNF